MIGVGQVELFRIERRSSPCLVKGLCAASYFLDVLEGVQYVFVMGLRQSSRRLNIMTRDMCMNEHRSAHSSFTNLLCISSLQFCGFEQRDMMQCCYVPSFSRAISHFMIQLPALLLRFLCERERGKQNIEHDVMRFSQEIILYVFSVFILAFSKQYLVVPYVFVCH